MSRLSRPFMHQPGSDRQAPVRSRTRVPKPIFVASLFAIGALLLTIGAAAATSSNGRANGHAGIAKLRLTPASGQRIVDASRLCDGKACFKITLSALYEYTPDAGGRTCPDFVALAWDSKPIGGGPTQGSHGSCVATLRKTVVSAASTALLALGRHVVCATVSGGPPISSRSVCATYLILPAAVPSPTARPTSDNDAPHPTAQPTGDNGAPHPTAPATAGPNGGPGPTARTTQPAGGGPRPTAAAATEGAPVPQATASAAVTPVAPAPIVTPVPATPVVPVPQASATPAATAPIAYNPVATATARSEPASAPTSETGNPGGGPLFLALLGLLVVLVGADIAYVARAVNRNW